MTITLPDGKRLELPEHATAAAVAAAIGPGLAAGLGLCAWAILLFRRFHTSPIPIVPSAALVIRGPYRFTRNPMYVGMALIYAGTALWLQLSWASLVLPVVLVVIYTRVITREERYLQRRFGTAYREYQLRVRRWL